MKVIDPGHEYALGTLDSMFDDDYVILTFVKRTGEGYPGNVGAHPGTTTQEVLRALIERTKYVDSQIHDDRNDVVLTHLRCAMYELEARAAERHGRLIAFAPRLGNIEELSTCEKCGHIACPGVCHK